MSRQPVGQSPLNANLALTQLEQKVWLFLRHSKVDSALHLIQCALIDQPSAPELLFLRGLCLQKKSDYRSAIRSLSDCLNICPNHLQALLVLSIIFSDLGQHEEADVLLQRIDQAQALRDYHKQKIVQAHINTSHSYRQAGQHQQALQELFRAKAISTPSLKVDVHYLIAKIYSDHGDFEKALSELLPALKLQPDHGNALNLQSYILDKSAFTNYPSPNSIASERP